MNIPRGSVSALSLALASSTLVLGCYASAGTAGPPPPAYQVTAGPAPVDDGIAYEAAPPSIETYPSVVYEGQPHYYVSGRWYVHTQRGWGYRRQEPPQLAQRRPAPRAEPQRGPEPQRREEERKDEKKEEPRRDDHR